MWLPHPLRLDLGLPKLNYAWLNAKAMHSFNFKSWLSHGKEGEATQLAKFGCVFFDVIELRNPKSDFWLSVAGGADSEVV